MKIFRTKLNFLALLISEVFKIYYGDPRTPEGRNESGLGSDLNTTALLSSSHLVGMCNEDFVRGRARRGWGSLEPLWNSIIELFSESVQIDAFGALPDLAGSVPPGGMHPW